MKIYVSQRVTKGYVHTIFQWNGKTKDDYSDLDTSYHVLCVGGEEYYFGDWHKGIEKIRKHKRGFPIKSIIEYLGYGSLEEMKKEEEMECGLENT